MLKKDDENFKIVSVIEIKNVLDKGSINSATDILSEVCADIKDSNTKYVLFSLSRISAEDVRAVEKLRKFEENENSFLITNEEGNLKPRSHRQTKFKVIDLSNFLETIKDEVIL